MRTLISEPKDLDLARVFNQTAVPYNPLALSTTPPFPRPPAMKPLCPVRQKLHMNSPSYSISATPELVLQLALQHTGTPLATPYSVSLSVRSSRMPAGSCKSRLCETYADRPCADLSSVRINWEFRRISFGTTDMLSMKSCDDTRAEHGAQANSDTSRQ